MPSLSEGGPAKWLKNKNLLNHHRDYEPGGREFESLRAQAQCTDRSENVAFFVTFFTRGASSMGLEACCSMRPATKESFSGARCAWRSTISYANSIGFGSEMPLCTCHEGLSVLTTPNYAQSGARAGVEIMA